MELRPVLSTQKDHLSKTVFVTPACKYFTLFHFQQISIIDILKSLTTFYHIFNIIFYSQSFYPSFT